MRIERFILKKYRHPKFSFFRDYTTWYSSNFYGTDRAHLNAPVEIKKPKIFSAWESGLLLN
jgi:hypothetical protein